MKQRPILMQPEMAKATNDGNKTQTRRTKGLELINENPNRWKGCVGYDPETEEYIMTDNKNLIRVKCPYGYSGDILWVRENWKLVQWCFEDGTIQIGYTSGDIIEFDNSDDQSWLANQVEQLIEKGYFIVDGDPEVDDESAPLIRTNKIQPWKPSIHMPKDIARLWMRIKSVRVKRLQDISEEDAISEGIKYNKNTYPAVLYNYLTKRSIHGGFPSLSFSTLWQSINGPGSWVANPWVWVIEFERIENPNA